MTFNQQNVETAAKEAVKFTKIEERSAKVEQFTTQDMRQEILKSKMTLKDENNEDVKVKTSDLVSAIIKDIWLTETNTSGQILQRVNGMEIKIGDTTLKPWQFTVGSTNVAYIQIALGADPDGYFGRDTLIAAKSMDMVDTVSNASNTPENIGEVSINFLAQENIYDDFWIEADKYDKTYKIFNADGTIKGLSISNGIVKMSYCYNIGQNLYNPILIRVSDIQNTNKNIDIGKFVLEIKNAIVKNEAKLYKNMLVESIQEWVKNVPISKFGYAQFDYIKANGWYTNGNMIDFAPADINSTGMKVEWDNLVVTYGTSGLTAAKLDINKISTDHKFDQAKFVAELQKQSLTKLAQLWIESRMRTYKTNGDVFPLGDDVRGWLDVKINNMKKWLTETKAFMNTLENTYKLTTNAAQKEAFKKQIASIEARIRLDEYYRMYKNFTKSDVSRSTVEEKTKVEQKIAKTQDQFEKDMENVNKKRSILDSHKQGSFDAYMAGTYKKIFAAMGYTE